MCIWTIFKVARSHICGIKPITIQYDTDKNIIIIISIPTIKKSILQVAILNGTLIVNANCKTSKIIKPMPAKATLSGSPTRRQRTTIVTYDYREGV